MIPNRLLFLFVFLIFFPSAAIANFHDACVQMDYPEVRRMLESGNVTRQELRHEYGEARRTDNEYLRNMLLEHGASPQYAMRLAIANYDWDMPPEDDIDIARHDYWLSMMRSNAAIVQSDATRALMALEVMRNQGAVLARAVQTQSEEALRILVGLLRYSTLERRDVLDALNGAYQQAALSNYVPGLRVLLEAGATLHTTSALLAMRRGRTDAMEFILRAHPQYRQIVLNFAIRDYDRQSQEGQASRRDAIRCLLALQNRTLEQSYDEALKQHLALSMQIYEDMGVDVEAAFRRLLTNYHERSLAQQQTLNVVMQRMIERRPATLGYIVIDQNGALLRDVARSGNTQGVNLLLDLLDNLLRQSATQVAAGQLEPEEFDVLEVAIRGAIRSVYDSVTLIFIMERLCMTGGLDHAAGMSGLQLTFRGEDKTSGCPHCRGDYQRRHSGSQ